jgi:hypothetical protein
MMQINDDYYEDLTPETTIKVLNELAVRRRFLFLDSVLGTYCRFSSPGRRAVNPNLVLRAGDRHRSPRASLLR